MPDTIDIRTLPCSECKKVSTLTVSKAGYEAWKGGALIQNALSDLTPDERELLVTGTHPQCWGELLSILDDAEGLD